MEAAHYELREDGKIQCVLCPNDCVISNGKSGACRVRTNHDGTLVADSYAEVVSVALDPIEKKPLYHFYPGSQILSVGPNGCNFHCGFCQNWGISQETAVTRHIEPEELAGMAPRNGSIGLAYTYTEPFIWFEYVRDTGKLVRERGMVNVLVTNGYVNEHPLRELLPIIDAMNIDVKSMRPEFYRNVCGGKLEDVLRTVEISNGLCHIEVTNLVITNYNDTDEDFTLLTDWLASVNPSIPLHFSRYFPAYRFTEPPTPSDRIKRACEIASRKLKYVYAGNITLGGLSDTRCPVCKNTLISRSYYTITIPGIENGKCTSCGTPAEVIGI